LRHISQYFNSFVRRVDDIILITAFYECNSFLLDLVGFSNLLLLLHCESLANEMVDIFANKTLAFEPVIHLSCGASDECCNVGFDFFYHAGEIFCVNSVGLMDDT
jgi:hypothetical protein